MQEKEFGFYKPRGVKATLLEILRRSGLNRGKIRKMIKEQWPKLGYEIMDAKIGGIYYRLHIRHNITDSIILTRSKFHHDKDEILALAQAAGNGNAFIDVGANSGHYSLNLVQRGYGKVIAIEPNPITLDILRFNVRQNGMEDKIIVAPFCVGNGEPIAFYRGPPNDLGRAGVFDHTGDSEPMMIESKPLLDIIQQENITQIGGMKLDIEGFEDQALAPFFAMAPRSLFPKIVVLEICGRGLWQQDIVQKMKILGYAVKVAKKDNTILTFAG